MTEPIYQNLPGTGFFTLRDTAGAKFAPTTVSLWIAPPGGSETPVTAITSATGEYTYSYTPTASGAHTLRVLGVTAGVIVARGRGQFYVSPDNY